MAGYQLYLIRHGVAEDRGEAWPDDAKRPLTAMGVERLRKSIRGVARLGVSLDVILTSPLVRTRQTSDIVASVFDPRPPIVVVDSLAPGGSYPSVLAEIEKQSRRSKMALVGHEPEHRRDGGAAGGSCVIGSSSRRARVCRIDMEPLAPQARGTAPVVSDASHHARAQEVARSGRSGQLGAVGSW